MQKVNELNTIPATRIANATQRLASCTECPWTANDARAAVKASRHAAATGHRVRSVVSRITFYVRTNRTNDNGEA